MSWYFAVKTLHIMSSAVLFGTGIGIAFFMLKSRNSADIAAKIFAARTTVIADFIFTLPAVIIQPLSGVALIAMAGYVWNEFWLVATYGLYILIGLCWIPVVAIQIELRKLIDVSKQTGDPLSERFDRLFRIWFILGWPAFLSLALIFLLMVAKPT